MRVQRRGRWYDKRGDKYSQRVSVTGTSGKRRQVRVSAATTDEVDRLARKVKSQDDQGHLSGSGQVALQRYLTDTWLPHVSTRVRQHTFRRYEALLRLHVTPKIGAVQLRHLRPNHVQVVVDAMTAKGLAPRSVIQAYRVLSSALRQATRWQLILNNPAAAVVPPRAERPALSVPDADSMRQLRDASSGLALEGPVTLSIATGMRLGEVLGLRWSAIDLDAGILRVTGSLEWLGREYRIVEPKTSRARRTIALPPFALAWLRTRRKRQAACRLLLGEAWPDTDLVLTRDDGVPFRTDESRRTSARLRAGQACQASGSTTFVTGMLRSCSRMVYTQP